MSWLVNLQRNHKTEGPGLGPHITSFPKNATADASRNANPNFDIAVPHASGLVGGTVGLIWDVQPGDGEAGIPTETWRFRCLLVFAFFLIKDIKEGFKIGCGYHVFYIFFIYVEGRFHRWGWQNRVVTGLQKRHGVTVRDDFSPHFRNFKKTNMKLSDPTRFGTNKRNPYSSMGSVYLPTCC